MIQQLVINQTKAGCMADYIQGAKAFVADQRSLPGCLAADVFTTAKPDEVAIMTTWTDEEAMNSAVAGELFLKHKPNLKPYFVANQGIILNQL